MAQRGRKPVEVRCWMIRNQVTPADIRNALGLADTTTVTKFLNGERTSRPVMGYLIGRGCPKEFFSEGRVAA